MTAPHRIALPLLLLLAAALLAGCGKSAPTHFYSLNSGQAAPTQEGAPAQEAKPAKAPCFSLGVGPVDFPAYLDRAQMVVRQGGNQMQVADFEQWVEPLQENFKRVLLENLEGSLCASPLVLHPWPVGVRPDYQVALQVLRFDGAPAHTAVLRASWSILDSQGELLVWKSSTLQESVAGPGYDALAAAQSRLVARLSQEIAQAFGGLKKK
ncbi:PqiC family protein [Fundidesulfovibrio agrisoli]|uniref:PqiC family protein n=1 Tax=Fundidesulfovibrio agrisoli TaxID=2922717 RepID=UPI001FAD15FF|nr:PqiC family protein [Fundidesulfovibrio agrisoli]